MNKDSPRVLAIIPCYNEMHAIGKLLQEFKDSNFSGDVLIIDDGSNDETYGVARQFTNHIIRFSENKGVPAAIKTGLHFAQENNYDFCVQIDGDGQHIPQQISVLLAGYERSSASLILGSRYYGQNFPRPINTRRMAGLLISAMIFVLFRRRWIYDSTTGMRMMDRAAIDYFSENLNVGWPDAVIVVQAINAGLPVKEIPVTMRVRLSGSSYLSGYKGVYFLARVIWDIMLIKYGRNPGRKSPNPALR